MRIGYRRVANSKLRHEVERLLTLGSQGGSVDRGLPCTQIDETQSTLAIMGDPCMLRGDASTSDADLAIGTRTYGDVTLADTGDHRVQLTNRPRAKGKPPDAQPRVFSAESVSEQPF